MKKLTAEVVAVYSSGKDDSTECALSSIQVELDGVVGDSHRSFERKTWAGGDKQPEGTVRRNERQWSAVSVEELAEVSTELGLTEDISAECVGANLCFAGIPELSRLPKGTLMKFPSGAELVVVEYNPPCGYMGEKVASRYSTNSGERLANTAFSKAAKLKRGIVGVVDVAGTIRAGDAVTVEVYETPSWLVRSDL